MLEENPRLIDIRLINAVDNCLKFVRNERFWKVFDSRANFSFLHSVWHWMQQSIFRVSKIREIVKLGVYHFSISTCGEAYKIYALEIQI